MNGNVAHALVFIINAILGLYTGAVMLRFLMQQVRGDFRNPLIQAVVKVTNPLLLPLRRVIHPWNSVDTAALTLMLLVQIANVVLVTFMANLNGYQLSYTPGYLALWTLIKLLYILLNLYFYTILLEAVLSWLGQGMSPMDGVLRPLNAPLLRPVRRLLPPLGGLDFSPLVVILLLQVILIYVLPSLWPFMGL
ncbi:MAG TPA: YggT family protein [Gammaproteobacteria bacterium]|nr:YggT family protein [Gammaproteobacteria bacterium]